MGKLKNIQTEIEEENRLNNILTMCDCCFSFFPRRLIKLHHRSPGCVGYMCVDIPSCLERFKKETAA